VTAPQEVRIQRVMQRDGITREKVEQWMQRQWSQEEVKRLADYEIINDGIADIDSQIERVLNSLTK
jgi:dephospho-CoA kinase